MKNIKKLLLLALAGVLFSCTASDPAVVTPTGEDGIGKVTFTYQGTTYNYTNNNYKDGGVNTAVYDDKKPSLFWQPTQAGISIAVDSGKGNDAYSVNRFFVVLSKTTVNNITSYGISMQRGNGTALIFIPINNSNLTYTENATTHRITGTFTSTECSGSFTDIVRI